MSAASRSSARTRHPPDADPTIAAYERYARRYAIAVDPMPSAATARGLHRLVEQLPAGSRVLEIGSGPGWDADYLETAGIGVLRTDPTAAFRAVQAERGKAVEALDIAAGDIAGRHPAIVMLAVIQHIARQRVRSVLAKLGGALAPRGLLLLSHPLGDRDLWEHGTSGDYRVVQWSVEAMDEALAQADFMVEWSETDDGEGGAWRWLLARRGS
ncbi:MAG: class I SAM-dependent methyltransferase [Lautropia sp.]